jgi:hypothetical protein
MFCNQYIREATKRKCHNCMGVSIRDGGPDVQSAAVIRENVLHASIRHP